MELYEKSDFAVWIGNGNFLCKCKGITRFTSNKDAELAWYIGGEATYALLWDIELSDGMVRKLMEITNEYKNDPHKIQENLSYFRKKLFIGMFQGVIKEDLLKISQSDVVWDTLGGNYTYNKYFPYGMACAVRDISGGGFSWLDDQLKSPL